MIRKSQEQIAKELDEYRAKHPSRGMKLPRQVPPIRLSEGPAVGSPAGRAVFNNSPPPAPSGGCGS